MATGSVTLMPGAAVFPDGTASNLAPQLQRVKSSAAAPMPYFLQLLFDAAQREQCAWNFVVPSDYGSGPILKVKYKMTSAVTGVVSLDARLSAVTPGDATDMDAKAYAAANVATDTVPATTAGFVKEVSITLANADSVAAGDMATLHFARDGAAGADTAAGDMEVVGLTFVYTVA